MVRPGDVPACPETGKYLHFICLRGVFAAGDMARRPSMPVPGALVVIGAVEGAVAIDQEFLFETLA